MNFLENIFSRLKQAAGRVLLAEAHASGSPGALSVTGSLRTLSASGDRTATGAELLAQIAAARAFLRASGLAKGSAARSLLQIASGGFALDLAILAEGLIAVPLYAARRLLNSSP